MSELIFHFSSTSHSYEDILKIGYFLRLDIMVIYAGKYLLLLTHQHENTFICKYTHDVTHDVTIHGMLQNIAERIRYFLMDGLFKYLYMHYIRPRKKCLSLPSHVLIFLIPFPFS